MTIQVATLVTSAAQWGTRSGFFQLSTSGELTIAQF